MTFATLLAAEPAFAAGTKAAADSKDSKAQPTEDSVKVAYREATAEYALGNFAEAKKKFELAFRIKQIPGLLFNIAQCHRQLRDFEAAANTYRSFIRLDPNNPQVELAKELLRQVENAVRTQNNVQMAPPLDANGSDAAPKKQVAFDLDAQTTVLAPAPPAQLAPLPPIAPASGVSTSAGTPPLLAVATQPRPADTTLAPATPPAKTTPPVKTAPPPKTAPTAPPLATAIAPAPAPSPVAAKSSNHILFWSGLGVGAVAVGTGIVFGAQSKSARDDLSSGTLTRSQADQSVSTMQRDATLGNVLLIGGVVLLAGAAAAFFLGAP